MAEHFTRNTLTATAWCLRCNRNTDHRIDGGRRGPCLDPAHPTPPACGKREKPAEQPTLFDERER